MLDAPAPRLPPNRPHRAGLAERRPGRLRRAARRIKRRLACLRRRTAHLPAGAFELEAAHKLPTSQLWGVWTVAHLESELALRAWRLSRGEQRLRAHRAYTAALEREAAAARRLAERRQPAPAAVLT